MYSFTGVYPPKYFCIHVQVFIHLYISELLYRYKFTWIIMYTCTCKYLPEYSCTLVLVYIHLNIYVLLYSYKFTWIFMYSCKGKYLPECSCTLVLVYIRLNIYVLMYILLFSIHGLLYISTCILLYCCKLYIVVHEYVYTQVGSVSVAELLYRSNLIAVVAGGRNPK